MFGFRDVDVTVRMAPEDESGSYAIGELAFINTVDEQEYVTSAGVAFRRDHMTPDVVRTRDKARKASRKSDD
jgi:hypothetical protein